MSDTRWEERTQAQRIDAVRTFLRQHEAKGRITASDGRLFERLLNLVRRHPWAEEKLDGGIVAFAIRPDWRGNIALFLERPDGSEVDVSWRKCALGVDQTDRRYLVAAMRHAVIDQIIEAINLWELSEPPCPLCGQPVARRDAHVDHEVPFDTMTRRFLDGRTDVPLEFDEDPKTHQTAFRTVDRDFAAAWREYHGANCLLRVTHAQCNLRRTRLA